MIDVGNNIGTALPLFLTSSCPCAYGIVLALQTCAVCISRPMPARQPHRLRSGTSLRDTAPLSRLVSQSQHRCTVPVFLSAPLRAPVAYARYARCCSLRHHGALRIAVLAFAHTAPWLSLTFRLECPFPDAPFFNVDIKITSANKSN